MTARDQDLTGCSQAETFEAAILGIACSDEMARGDFTACVRRIVETAANALAVERVSVWIVREGGAVLECISLFQASRGAHSSGARLLAADYAGYFAALESGRSVVAQDAAQDPRTCEFARGYLREHDIVSMMDSVVRVEGEVIGVVCHEQVGHRRSWSPDEVAFAGDVADQVATAFLTARGRESEAELEQLTAELRQSQRLEAAGRLASGIAHDFNNLLSVIVGHTEIGVAQAASAGTVDTLTRIRIAAEHAATLVTRLQRLGRQQGLETDVVDLDKVFESVHMLLARVLPANITLESDFSDEPALALADAGQLEQALMNLCLNARDALNGGGVIRVSTRVERDAEKQRWSVLAVSDNGIGMPPEVAERALEPFFSTKQADGAGAGLGLSMVHSILRQHGGNVEVQSRHEAGTTVLMRLPYHGGAAETPAVADVENVAAPFPSSPPTLNASGSPARILVAEDAEGVRDVARRILTEAGYSVTTARDGEAALERFREMQAEIDLLLLDVVMPRLNGREVLKAIRAEGHDVPAVFVTAHRGGTDEELGEVEVVRKPWSASGLLGVVSRALQSRSIPEQPL